MEDKDSWLQRTWRPMMGWTYMITCIFDFMIGPIYYNLLQYYNPGQHIDMWQAITLQGGGLYHLAMGAILGISAYGRTQEKISPNTNSQYMMPDQRYSQPDRYSEPNSNYYNQQPDPQNNNYEMHTNSYASPMMDVKPVRKKHAGKPIPPADKLL